MRVRAEQSPDGLSLPLATGSRAQGSPDVWEAASHHALLPIPLLATCSVLISNYAPGSSAGTSQVPGAGDGEGPEPGLGVSPSGPGHRAP